MDAVPVVKGPELDEMPILDLVQFSLRTLRKADHRKMAHGLVIVSPGQPLTNPNTGEQEFVLASEFCGCAVGTIALADGERIVKEWQSTMWQGTHFRTDYWKAGSFAAQFFASVSRAFENDTKGNPITHRYALRADLRRAVARVKAILAIVTARPTATPSDLRDEIIEKVDIHFGSINMV